MAQIYRRKPRGPLILVVDEDKAIRTLLRRELTTAGYRVEDSDSDEATRYTPLSSFDLLILDIDSAANEAAIRRLRQRSLVPILVTSDRRDDDAIISAFEIGVDEYVAKPFSSKEIVARAGNVMRRRARRQGKQSPLIMGDLEIDLSHRRVRLCGKDVHISPKPYEVLRVLAENPGEPIAYETILRAVWGRKPPGRIEYLRLAIQNLRTSLERDPSRPRHIITEMRVGYRLSDESSNASQRRINPSSFAGSTEQISLSVSGAPLRTKL
jgi:two-component system, OmpR family, KDP operon response regulator KdpE